MNYVEIKGGLGNQLFQYAFYKYCEKVTGRIVLLHTDFFNWVNDMEGTTVRKLELDKFNTDYVSVQGSISCRKIIHEEEFTGVEPDADYFFYSGYWQDKQFFEEVRDDIIREVSLKSELISNELRQVAREIRGSESIAMHFRRGDYLSEVNKQIFAQQGVDYYLKAIDVIRDKAGSDGLEAYVFTDDIEYFNSVKDSFADISLHVMPIREAYEDLYLMSCAKHHIIANSSFSWWGAAISQDESGVTVAPAKWFLDRPQPNLYLDKWVTV